MTINIFRKSFFNSSLLSFVCLINTPMRKWWCRAYDKAAIQCNGREAVTNFESSSYQGQIPIMQPNNQGIHPSYLFNFDSF